MTVPIVGGVGVEVFPTSQSFARKLRDDLVPAADRVGTEVGRTLGDRIRSTIGQVGVKLDTTEAKAKVDVVSQKVRDIGGNATKIRVDTSEIDARIDALKAKMATLTNQRLTVSVDTATANAKLAVLNAEADKLKGDIKAKADIDVGAAKARLAEIAAEIQGIRDGKAKVRIDKAEAEVQLAQLRAELDAATKERRVKIDAGQGADSSGLFGGISSAQGGMSGLVAAAIGLGPALIPVAAAAIPLIAGIGAAAVGAGAGIGVLALAFHGIGAAVSALGAQSHQTGQQLALQSSQQLAAADSILNAQDAVKAAVQGVADARRSAALSVQNADQGVLSAEQALTSAQYNETQAQLSLTQARRQAAQTLQDLSNQVKDGALTQRQATLDLQSAQQNLTVVDFNPHSTAQQRAEAQLAVDQAKQRLAEVGLANQRLAQQKALADKQGVANAPAVLTAEHAVADATQSRVNAQQNLIRAQAAVVEAQRAGAEQVAKADQQVVQSQRALAQAYASAGARGSAAANKVAEAMAGLSPAGRAFALFVNDKLRPALHSLTDAAQTGFLPGLQAALTILLPYLPDFAKFIGAIGREMGNMAVQAAKAFTSPWWRQFFGFLADMAQSSLPILGTILLNLATGFAGLFQAISPAGAGLGSGLERISKAFADWATHLGTNQGFQKFLQFVKDNAPQVGRFLANLGEIVGKLIIALAPLGALLAFMIEKVATFLARLTPGQMLAIAAGIGAIAIALTFAGGVFSAFSLGAGALVLAVAAIAAALVYAYTHSKTFRDEVQKLWAELRPSLAQLGATFRDVLNTIGDRWKVLIPIVILVAKITILQIKFLSDALTAAWFDIIKPTLEFIGAAWHLLAINFSAVYNAYLKPLWTTMGLAFTSVGKAFGEFRDGLSTIWTDIKTIFVDGYNFVTQNVLNKFIDAVNKVTSVLGVPKIPDIPALKPPAPAGVVLGPGPGGRAAFAHGGVVPGYAPGMDIVEAKLSPGEGVLVPEAVQALGPGFVHALNRRYSNRLSSPGHFTGGGVAGGVLDAGAEHVLSGLESPIKALIARLTPEIVKKLAQGGYGRLDGGIRSWIKDHVGGIGAGVDVASLAHSALIKAALRLAGVADTPGNEGDVNIIVSHESGWNPNAINLTDSNARAGHPSQGLMQTIPSTFQAWRLPSLSDSITDPVANLVAGIRYVVGRYGSLDQVPGVAAVHAGGQYVGYDSGGYLPPGISQVYNGTGRPEPVFTDAQWAKLTGQKQPRQQPKIADHVSIHGLDAATVFREFDRRQQMANLAP